MAGNAVVFERATAMSMTSKERMMRALAGEKPDRLPVTIHQWQQYHLDTYLGGMDALDAFKTCGLDASIQYFEAMGQFWLPNAEKFLVQSPHWREEIKVVKDDPDDKLLDHTITTPGGQLDLQDRRQPHDHLDYRVSHQTA